MFGFKPKKLYTGRVFQTFKDIANLSGKDTQKAKKGKIIELLKNCQGSEPKYLIRYELAAGFDHCCRIFNLLIYRCLAGSLRIGLAEKSIFSAVARASVLTFPSTRKLKGQELTAQLEKATEIFRDLYNQCPNYEMIIPKLLEVGVNALPQYITLTPGIPLKPMLAHPTKAITEVLDRFEGLTFTCEFKYDGERAQVRSSTVLFLQNSYSIRSFRSIGSKTEHVIYFLETAKTCRPNIRTSWIVCPALQKKAPTRLYWIARPLPGIERKSVYYLFRY